MSEKQGEYNVIYSPTVATAFARLVQDLGVERILQLADLVGDVIQDTGYGNVKIIINERRVIRFTSEKSYPGKMK